MHWEWYDLFLAQLRGDIRHLAIQAPKSHAKSTIFSKVLPLYLTCVPDAGDGVRAKMGPNVRIVNGSVNSDLAEQFLLSARSELERNELLIEDFGPFRPTNTMGEKWTQSRLIVAQRTATSQSPTWRAVGTGKPVQGGRSDWCIGDDICDIDNSSSLLQRNHLETWFEGDFMGTLEPDEPAGAGGHAIIIGTAKHADDELHRLEKRSRQPGSGWVFRRYDAIVDEEQRKTLWPARWSWDALAAKRLDIGGPAFNRDFRNIATLGSGWNFFPPEDLRIATDPELTSLLVINAVDDDDLVAWAELLPERALTWARRYTTHRYVHAWDLADKSDYVVGTTWDVSTMPRATMIEFERFRRKGWAFNKARIRARHQKYNTMLTGIDSTGVGDAILDDLSDIRAEGMNFAGGRKAEGLGVWQRLINLQQVRWPHIGPWLEEHASYHVEDKDLVQDCVMSGVVFAWFMRSGIMLPVPASAYR